MQVGASGKRRVVFDHSAGFGPPISLACGQCIGCRLERSRQWAMRCVYEAQLHDENCFVTLTYADEFIPPDGSLVKADFQKFMKRLRKRFPERKMKYFHCGEYGERLQRPHYHACLFGFDFPDKEFFKFSESGERLYVSEILASLWRVGHCLLGAVTFESSAYVARYCLKKITGDAADEHYQRVTEFGELVKVEPEYVTMSRRPGIAAEWFDKFSSDVYPDDFCVVRGMKMPPPRFFDNRYELMDPGGLAELKAKRVERAKARAADSTPERLRVRETVKRAQLKFLNRSYENEP